jgi:hypothetical protein
VSNYLAANLEELHNCKQTLVYQPLITAFFYFRINSFRFVFLFLDVIKRADCEEDVHNRNAPHRDGEEPPVGYRISPVTVPERQQLTQM